MAKYPDEVKAFIRQHVVGTTTKDLVELVNTEFSLNFTESKIKAYKSNHNLKSGTPLGVPKGTPSKQFPKEIRLFITTNYKGTGPKDMMELLNRTFGTDYTHNQIKAYYKNHKLNCGLTGYFPKGNIPFNKGKKGISYEGMKATQFKKGNKPANWVPLGTERLSKDGYIEVKIADGKLNKNWKAKHIFIWETTNGPVPKGHVVIFGDGDKRNFDIDNLLLVSRAQLVRLNQKKLIQSDAELTKTAILIVDIQNKIGERKKGSKKCRN